MENRKNWRDVARDVLEAEAEGIRYVAEQLDEDFDAAVDIILKCAGRVVVTGIGKSAIIGQKIVATLNSTGTPALFMHAADAIHGDLGMIQQNDVVLCLSKSGNTPEIKVLLPLLRRAGVRLIALVSDTNSLLAQQANYVLAAPVVREADPLNLAPTTSTTVALALGDALAVALLEGRGFTRHDFARYHPGGALGKKLYLKAADLYPQHPCPQVPPTADINAVIVEMTSKRLGCTAVVENATLVGIITDGDLRRMLNQHDTYRHLTAADIMTPAPLCVSPDDYAVQLLEIMQRRNITQLIVADNGRLLGFVHLHDLLKEGLV